MAAKRTLFFRRPGESRNVVTWSRAPQVVARPAIRTRNRAGARKGDRKEFVGIESVFSAPDFRRPGSSSSTPRPASDARPPDIAHRTAARSPDGKGARRRCSPVAPGLIGMGVLQVCPSDPSGSRAIRLEVRRRVASADRDLRQGDHPVNSSIAERGKATTGLARGRQSRVSVADHRNSGDSGAGM